MVVYLWKKLLQLYFSLSGPKHWLHIHQCIKKLGGIGSSSRHVRTCFFSLPNNVEYFGLFFYTWETFFTALKGKLELATSTKKQNHHWGAKRVCNEDIIADEILEDAILTDDCEALEVTSNMDTLINNWSSFYPNLKV